MRSRHVVRPGAPTGTQHAFLEDGQKIRDVDTSAVVVVRRATRRGSAWRVGALVQQAFVATTAPLSAIDGRQSVLSPAGIQAAAIHHLWSVMLWTSIIVTAVVLTGVLFALRRGIRNQSPQTPSITSERALARAVSLAVGTTVVILGALLVASVRTGRALGSLHASSAVTIEITGHQWWWEIQYDDAMPSRRVVTANEVHIPIHRPVVLKVTSRDVIHSLWVPNLQGKRDLIPGYTTALWLQADHSGVFRGQCAEFCGLQHAHMALDVIAESDDAFEGWLAAMRRSVGEPPQGAARTG